MTGELLYIVGLIGGILLAIYLIMMIYLYVNQKNMIYFPTQSLIADPSAVGLKFDNIKMEISGGEIVHGWYVPAEKEIATILFFHGNGGNISHRLETIRLLHDLGLSVFIIDYRGYGQSGGEPSESNSYADAEAAYQYLIDSLGKTPEKIIIMGRSLGGAIAVELAMQKRVAGLIVESSFSSAGALGQEMFSTVPIKLILKHKYDSIKKIGRINIPKLIIHSSEDDMIPFHHGRKLYEAASEPKKFLEISGPHTDGFLISIDKYRQGLRSFLYELFEQSTNQD